MFHHGAEQILCLPSWEVIDKESNINNFLSPHNLGSDREQESILFLTERIVSPLNAVINPLFRPPHDFLCSNLSLTIEASSIYDSSLRYFKIPKYIPMAIMEPIIAVNQFDRDVYVSKKPGVTAKAPNIT